MLALLQEELKAAMKDKDKATLTGLRNIIGKLKARQIDKGEMLNEEESIKILHSSAKQLKDSIEQYKNGGREDLVKKEEFELKLIEKFLPEQISIDDVRIVVQKTIESTGARSMHDIGRVMGIVMKELVGSTNGKIVHKIVQEELGS